MRQIPSICIDFKYDFLNECADTANLILGINYICKKLSINPKFLRSGDLNSKDSSGLVAMDCVRDANFFIERESKKPRRREEPANFPFEYR